LLLCNQAPASDVLSQDRNPAASPWIGQRHASLWCVGVFAVKSGARHDIVLKKSTFNFQKSHFHQNGKELWSFVILHFPFALKAV
jgi:hypothetical protein